METFFFENDRKKAVLQIQKWLRFLEGRGYAVPLLYPDGIYGEKTVMSVRAFQKIENMDETGKVDYRTWCTLEKRVKELYEQTVPSKPIYPFEQYFKEGSYKKGDRILFTYIIQTMIETILISLDPAREQKVTGIFDSNTEENIKMLQKIWNLKETGEIQKSTWNRLAVAYNYRLNRE